MSNPKFSFTQRRIGACASILALTLSPNIRAALPTSVHPGWTVVNIRPKNFEPMVTGLGFLSDGRLVVSHWGGQHSKVAILQKKGAVYILSNVTGDNPNPVVTTYAENLEDPLGMLVKDDRIYVSGGEKLIELPDANHDGKADTARIIATIPGTHARHEFLFGLIFKDGKFWMNPSSAKDIGGDLPSWGQKNPNRGTVMSVDPETGEHEVFAMGLREPNGIGIGPEDEIFVPDVQGNWLPQCKLINVKKGRFYGFKHEPAETWDNLPLSPAAVDLPQGEISRAPGNPLLIPSGLYQGQMFLGDAVVGGIRRIFLEKVAGEYQGTVFFHSGGLEAGPNRLMWGPDGYLYVGMCGQGAPSWAYKEDFGLQKMKPNGKTVFEMLAVRSRAGGMEIEFTQEVNAAALDKSKYSVKMWHYVSTSEYGGPQVGAKTLSVASVTASPDMKSVYLEIPGLVSGNVVHIGLAPDIASKGGQASWTAETWYTLNAISDSPAFQAPLAILAGKDASRASWDRQIRVGTGQGRLTVRLAGVGSAALEVRNLRGILVAKASGRERLEAGIPTANWAPGVYSVQVREGENLTVRRALISESQPAYAGGSH